MQLARIEKKIMNKKIVNVLLCSWSENAIANHRTMRVRTKQRFTIKLRQLLWVQMFLLLISEVSCITKKIRTIIDHRKNVNNHKKNRQWINKKGKIPLMQLTTPLHLFHSAAIRINIPSTRCDHVVHMISCKMKRNTFRSLQLESTKFFGLA